MENPRLPRVIQASDLLPARRPRVRSERTREGSRQVTEARNSSGGERPGRKELTWRKKRRGLVVLGMFSRQLDLIVLKVVSKHSHPVVFRGSVAGLGDVLLGFFNPQILETSAKETRQLPGEFLLLFYIDTIPAIPLPRARGFVTSGVACHGRQLRTWEAVGESLSPLAICHLDAKRVENVSVLARETPGRRRQELSPRAGSLPLLLPVGSVLTGSC